MKIKIHHTGSKGNLYSIDNGKDKLLIECGVPIKKINKAVNFKLSEYCGCLVSHYHKDHSESLIELINRGINCYAIKETFEHYNIDSPFTHIVEPKKSFNVGSFTVMPFDIAHTCPNVGFLIVSGQNKLLFATDLVKCVHRFSDLTHIMIECNYDRETLDKNFKAGKIAPAYYKNIIEGHFELWQAQEFLKYNISESTEEVYLIHGSRLNL